MVGSAHPTFFYRKPKTELQTENPIMQDSIIKELAAIVGPEHVLTTPEERWSYAYDATDRAAMPDVVVFPGSAAEISAIVRLANEHRFPVVPRGAGTGRSGGSVPIEGGVVLVLTRLNRILEISRPDLVAVVEPGVILTRLKKAVEAQGFYYPPDPASADFCTIGGNVAECAGGAVAVQYGVTRDYVLGLEVVLPTGEIIDAGTRTMKGVVGYDLTRLFLGSEGTLGVITRITLRLVAKPPARQTLAAGFSTLEKAAEAVSLILTSGLAPTALEFMDHVTLSCVQEMLPFEVPAATGPCCSWRWTATPRTWRSGPPAWPASAGSRGPARSFGPRPRRRRSSLWRRPEGHFAGAAQGEAPQGERGRGGAPGGHSGVDHRLTKNFPAPGAHHPLLRPCRGRQYPRQRAL